MLVRVLVVAIGPDAATVTGAFAGNHVDGWARSLRCTDGTGILLVLFAPDPRTAQRIGARAASARCARPGETPSSWPDAPNPAAR